MPATNLHEVRWIHGALDCRQSADPPLQVVEYDEDTFVLRQSMCVHPEAPFMYLLFGRDAVLLHDTGATKRSPLRRTVDEIIEKRLRARGQESIRLLVSHSHGHTDHIAADSQFDDLPAGSKAERGVDGVAAFFGITDWPFERGSLNLGGRILDALPSPGHFEDHIFLFDRSRGLLLTGDTVYPGLLVVHDWAAYRQSIGRAARFCRESANIQQPVTHVLGAHIEMSNQPGGLFELGISHHPDEHPLPLSISHLFELESALEAAGNRPTRIERDHFVVAPAP